jgi:hypothetical protein
MVINLKEDGMVEPTKYDLFVAQLRIAEGVKKVGLNSYGAVRDAGVMIDSSVQSVRVNITPSGQPEAEVREYFAAAIRALTSEIGHKMVDLAEADLRRTAVAAGKEAEQALAFARMAQARGEKG